MLLVLCLWRTLTDAGSSPDPFLCESVSNAVARASQKAPSATGG